MGVVLVKNNKGGVGKTWIALQLAGYKALIENEKTLILTSDSQNNILNYSGIKIQDVNKKGLEDMLENKGYSLTQLRPNLFFLHLQGYKLGKNLDEKFKTKINELRKDFENIVIPTFLDSVTSQAILNMIKNTEISKIRAVVPNRVGRTAVEKKWYSFLKEKLVRTGIQLAVPIAQSSIILKFIEKGTLLWESRSQKVNEIKSVFEKIWKEIDDE